MLCALAELGVNSAARWLARAGRCLNRSVVTLGLTLLAITAPAISADAPSGKPLSFARIANDDSGRPLALQVAVASYLSEVDGESVQVDLIGAVHVGEPEYYATLNDRFSAYDVVLYELIAPEGTRVSGETEADGWLSMTQLAMTKGLDLSFQLEQIDYQATNFVHADLSPKQFKQAMQQRGESPLVMAWRLFAYSMRESARSQLPQYQVQALSDAFASSGDSGVKLLLARELTKTESMQQVFGKDSDNSIIGARNARAIEVLERELAAGQRRVAIFYGVAHLHDFHRRMTEELGYRHSRTDWLDAWFLQAPD